MLCPVCKKEHKNPKFCSRSCSATYANSMTPKRKLEGTCKTCKKPAPAAWTYCKSCKYTRQIMRSQDQTIEQVRELFGAYEGHAKIRSWARTLFKKSGLPKVCKHCGYSLHVEIAHIIPVGDFDKSTPVNEVNRIDNLVPLCRNHHWEFDHGHLKL